MIIVEHVFLSVSRYGTSLPGNPPQILELGPVVTGLVVFGITGASIVGLVVKAANFLSKLLHLEVRATMF